MQSTAVEWHQLTLGGVDSAAATGWLCTCTAHDSRDGFHAVRVVRDCRFSQ